MVVHRLSSFINNLEEGRVPQGMRFFSLHLTDYLRIEISSDGKIQEPPDHVSYTMVRRFLVILYDFLDTVISHAFSFKGSIIH